MARTPRQHSNPVAGQAEDPLSASLPDLPDSLPQLLQDLEATPGNFAFPQAVQLMRRYLKTQGTEEDPIPLRFRVNPNLAFPPSDILSVSLPRAEDEVGEAPQAELLQDEAQRTKEIWSGLAPALPTQPQKPMAEMVLNLMGLHGAGSPVPTYFTEHVAQHQDEPDPLRDFFDMFNHRLVGKLYDAWEKYRYYLLFQPGAADKLSGHFFGFIGLGHKEIRAAQDLRWSKLLSFMGLIAFNGDAAGSLESIMRHYFSHRSVFIVPCIVRRVAIPKDQQSCLGLANTTLGEGCLLGEEVPDQTGKFRVRISRLNWWQFNDFLPCNIIFDELKSLVQFVLRSRIDFDVELRLRPDEIQPLAIGEATVCRLGWSTWLGDDGDGIVVLQT